MADHSAQHIDAFVDDYLHGVLYDDDAARFEQHCDTCQRCQNLVEEGRKRNRREDEAHPAEDHEAPDEESEGDEKQVIDEHRGGFGLPQKEGDATTIAHVLFQVAHGQAVQ